MTLLGLLLEQQTSNVTLYTFMCGVLLRLPASCPVPSGILFCALIKLRLQVLHLFFAVSILSLSARTVWVFLPLAFWYFVWELGSRSVLLVDNNWLWLWLSVLPLVLLVSFCGRSVWIAWFVIVHYHQSMTCEVLNKKLLWFFTSACHLTCKWRAYLTPFCLS